MLVVQYLLDRCLNFTTDVWTTALDAATVAPLDELNDLSLPEKIS